VADQIRGELALMLAKDVHDPGIGFVTLTRVQISPDLQVARVFYTVLGDEKARKNSARALERAASFLRRQIGSRLRLKRVPELRFQYDDATAGADRIDQIINELHERERDELRLKADTTVTDTLEPDTTTDGDGGD
jgi:ribosome-binding factor A